MSAVFKNLTSFICIVFKEITTYFKNLDIQYFGKIRLWDYLSNFVNTIFINSEKNY